MHCYGHIATVEYMDSQSCVVPLRINVFLAALGWLSERSGPTRQHKLWFLVSKPRARGHETFKQGPC